jgi:hypothetical protein
VEGVIVCGCGRRMRVVRERGMPDAEHGVAVDRFAREIAAFLKVVGGALAATERQTVSPHSSSSLNPVVAQR